jgi:hypothetical protein
MSTIKKNLDNTASIVDINAFQEVQQQEKSVFEQAILEQEQQFQTGIENLKHEIENIFQLRSKYIPIIGNHVSRFHAEKNTFQE